MARADLVRHQLFLSRGLSERLETLARGPGASKSRVLASALAAYLERKGETELERQFAHRLDRITNQLARIERNGQVELESLALFVRYMLTVNAPLAEGDKAAQAIGRDRFASFVERVGVALASGHLSLLPGEGE
jgi:predicted transcriptional regulator